MKISWTFPGFFFSLESKVSRLFQNSMGTMNIYYISLTVYVPNVKRSRNLNKKGYKPKLY